jgi:hypothetical protein
MLYTAAYCVLAVRLEAGLDEPQSPQKLKAYMVLSKQITHNFTDFLVEQSKNETYDKPSARGKDACGSEEQFKAYVSDLKATLGL